MKYEDYPTELKDVPVGKRFCMLNYKPIHIRIDLGPGLKHANPETEDAYIPILDLESGRLSLMVNTKPCRIWGA